MLVLSRRCGTGVHIGSDISVRILSIRKHAVKVGIEAPQSVRVWRDELAALPDEPRPPDERQPRAAGMKIVLVVEDDPGHAQLIRKTLCRSQGTMVTVAESADAALHALGIQVTDRQEIVQPDLVLLDLGLPDTSGLDVLRMVRSAPQLRTAPVVMLSCTDEQTVMHDCLEAGANAFVVKSAGRDDFQALVRRIGQFWACDCLTRRRWDLGQQDGQADLPGNPLPTARDAEPPETERGIGRNKRILLVDDDAGHVTLIKRALARSSIGCAVDVVGSGVEAVDYLFAVGQYAARRPGTMPDLILLDLNMPEMSGRQLLRVLCKTRREGPLRLPPVVVLTASDEQTDIQDSYNLGAQSFIRKPVHHGRFMEAVQQATTYWLGLNQSPTHAP